MTTQNVGANYRVSPEVNLPTQLRIYREFRESLTTALGRQLGSGLSLHQIDVVAIEVWNNFLNKHFARHNDEEPSETADEEAEANMAVKNRALALSWAIKSYEGTTFTLSADDVIERAKVYYEWVKGGGA